MSFKTKSRFGALAAPVAFSTGAGAAIPNNGIAFVLPGGQSGLKLTHLHIGAPLIASATLKNVSYRLMVINGTLPLDVSAMQVAFEPNALASFPAEGVEGFQFDVLYQAVYALADWQGNAISVGPDHCDFNDWTGPQVGPNETMTVMLFPIWTTEAAATPFANSQSIFLQMNCFGKNLDSESFYGRAIPRDRV